MTTGMKTMNWFKKEDPKELAKQAKRDTRREVRVSTLLLLSVFVLLHRTTCRPIDRQ